MTVSNTPARGYSDAGTVTNPSTQTASIARMRADASRMVRSGKLSRNAALLYGFIADHLNGNRAALGDYTARIPPDQKVRGTRGQTGCLAYFHFCLGSSR